MNPDYIDDRLPWEFCPNEETEKLQFNKIEDEVDEVDFSDLKEIDLEQAFDIKFFTVSGSAAFDEVS